MNLPSYISIQAVVMLFLFGTSVCYLIGRRKTNRPFLMALIGGVLAIMPPLFIIYLLLLLLKKDLAVDATSEADDGKDEQKPL
jgi:hypothetical protein